MAGTDENTFRASRIQKLLNAGTTGVFSRQMSTSVIRVVQTVKVKYSMRSYPAGIIYTRGGGGGSQLLLRPSRNKTE